MLNTAFKLCSCAILPFVLLAASAAQQEGAARDFVQQILARGGSPRAVAVTFQNVSGLPQESQERLQNFILTAFRDAGVRVGKGEQAAEVQIAFSEDWQGPVWIATVQRGDSRPLVIKRMARAQEAAARGLMVTLRRIPVWQQDSPILDFFQDNQNLLVLEPGQLALYANDSGQWRPRHTLAIPHEHVWPRDLRGRLHVSGGQISAFLPGTRCSGAISPPALDCRSSDDPWPLDQDQLVAFFNGRRNFFTGLLSGRSAGANVGPFFSGAAWQNGDQRQWLFAGVDGRTRLFQGDLSAPATTFRGWGSTVAAVHSGCGPGWHLVASSPADTIHADSVQAMEIAGHEALPASAPLELGGTVEALWSAGNYSQVVNGVMRYQATKRYEAFTVTVICNQ
jgi:hypothetical protein